MKWCVTVFRFEIRQIEKNSVNALSKDKLLSNIRSKMFQKMFPNVKCFHMRRQLLFYCRYQNRSRHLGSITKFGL